MADAAFLRRRVRPPSERSACDNAPPHLGMSFAAAGVDITASNKGRGRGSPVSASSWPEENERVSEVRLSSWTLAQDTDKPKFAEHYHDSTDITFPEGTRGEYTRDSMPVSATQYAPHSLPLVSPLCISTTLTQCANAPDRRRKPVEPARPLCLCSTGLRGEEVLGTGAPRLAGAARRGGA